MSGNCHRQLDVLFTLTNIRTNQQAGIHANIVVATSATQVESIRGQLPDDVDVVVEPERRNTFPAIVLAASYLESRKQMNPEETVIVLPVDPYVDVAYFETFKKMDEQVQKSSAICIAEQF
mgnify:CR=1 FL=1